MSSEDLCQTINSRIGQWAGVKPQDNCQYSWCEFPGVKCDPSCKNKVFTYPDYYGSNSAIDLLDVLVERGYCPELYYTVDSDGFAAWFFSVNPGHGEPYCIKETIPAAICTAILELIEREGK